MEGYGKHFTYERIDILALPESFNESKIKTNLYFNYLTGIAILNSSSDPIELGIKQRNKFVLNPIPIYMFKVFDFFSVIEYMIPIFAEAKGEDIFFVIKNKTSSSKNLKILLFYSNIIPKKIFNYDSHFFKAENAYQKWKLNINNNCKQIKKIGLIQTYGLPEFSISLFDTQITFLKNIEYEFLNTKNKNRENSLLPVDIPVTELYLLKRSRNNDEQFYFVYAWEKTLNK